MGPMNPMNWDDLRHFLAAYREKSLAGAARVLGCEYTTVGRRLSALEAALGSTPEDRRRDRDRRSSARPPARGGAHRAFG
jgi:DNA-binding transcriptional LysR family regulator